MGDSADHQLGRVWRQPGLSVKDWTHGKTLELCSQGTTWRRVSYSRNSHASCFDLRIQNLTNSNLRSVWKNLWQSEKTTWESSMWQVTPCLYPFAGITVLQLGILNTFLFNYLICTCNKSEMLSAKYENTSFVPLKGLKVGQKD